MHFIRILAKISAQQSETCSLLVLSSARQHFDLEAASCPLLATPLYEWTFCDKPKDN